jgi:hypothetical protein
MRHLYLIFFALFFLMSGCVKEEFYEFTSTQNDEPQEVVKTTLYGLIKNSQDQPVSGANITLNTLNGAVNIQSDEKGNFSFDSVLVAKSAYLQIQKTGYFDASRRMAVQAFSYNYTVVQMMERSAAGFVENATGGVVTLENGSQLSLPANGVAYENGSPYAGTVHVMMNSIDPASLDLFEQMPGDLTGYGTDGQLSSMASYGMLMVELEAEDGTLLQMAEGMEAELQFVIPDALLAEAPSQIPLWYFNEEKGYWYEEGSAVRQFNKYIGKVSHFSTWNCDMKGEVIDLSGAIACDNDNDLLPYMKVYLFQEEVPLAGGYLSSGGAFTFLNFYANEVFTLKVFNHCDELLWENEFGPYSEDVDLGELIIEDCGPQVLISGSAVDCDGNAVQDGLLQLFTASGQLFKTDFENGYFEIATVTCLDPNMSVIITDVANQKSSQPVDFVADVSEINLGTIEVCDELDEYFVIYYELPDGDSEQDTILYLDPSFKSYEQEGHFVEFSNDLPDSLNYEGGSLGFVWNTMQTGLNNAQSFYYTYAEQGVDEYSCQYGIWQIPPLPDFEVEILELDLNAGGILKGTFEGQVRTNTDDFKLISGKFKVRVE